jgi:hypothetical protein
VPLTNAYCTLPQVKRTLGISDTLDDDLIELNINAASRQIDGHCGRRFWQDGTVQDRQFWADDPSCLYVSGMDGDISTVTGLVVKTDDDGDGTFETTLTIATDFILLPANAADRTPVWPYEEIRLVGNYSFPRLSNGRPGVQVTAKFGWPAVPDDVEEACIRQAAQLYEAKNAVLGAVALGETAGMRVGRGMNPFAESLLAPYRLASIW